MLKKRARGAKTAYRDWQRAQIVLAAARGRASARIAADLHVSADTVRKWRGRFADRGLDGLADLPRSGRPRRISALERAAVVVLACQRPHDQPPTNLRRHPLSRGIPAPVPAAKPSRSPGESELLGPSS